MIIKVRTWLYDKVSKEAEKYHRSLIAVRQEYRDLVCFEIEEIIGETAKSITVDAKFYKTVYGDIIDMRKYSGYYINIPKSAVIK